MADTHTTTRVHTVVIGGGQAGLSVGYHLSRRGVPFVILDASARIGDAWRHRWDSLRLFTPAKFSNLDGMPFPADRDSFPTKDQMADYLETYARTFHLPVRSATRVDRLSRLSHGFLVVSGHQRFEADNVVVAMGNYQRPRIPPFARELNPRIVQLHSCEYRRPSQLQQGDVLVVGAGNSGAEIAIEAARNGHRTRLAGHHVGHIPVNIESLAYRLVFGRVVLRGVFHHLLTIDTAIGRKVRPKVLHGAAPLIRLKPKHLTAAGVQRVPRVVGVRNGLPLLESAPSPRDEVVKDESSVLDVANVVWCTGYDSGFSWIDLPVFDADGQPQHEAGIVAGEPGLYFVGLDFLYAFSSEMIQGVGRDAARIADAIAAKTRSRPQRAQESTAA